MIGKYRFFEISSKKNNPFSIIEIRKRKFANETDF